MSQWPEKVQAGFSAWKHSQIHVAANCLLEGLAMVPVGAENDLWRVLIHSHLALVMLQGSRYEEANHCQQRANQIWQQAGLAAGPELRPSVDWFVGLLRSADLQGEADQLLAQLEAGQPLIADLWGGASQVGITALGGQQGSRVQGEADRGYAPLGGKVLETAPATQAMPAPVSWEAGITESLRLVSRDKCKEAIRCLEQVRALAVDSRRKDLGLRLLYTHNAEVLTHFFVGDYPASDRARNEAQQLWPSLSLNHKIGEDPITRGFWRLLEMAQRPDLADLLRGRLERGQCPVLNPWEDLGGTMPQKLEEQQPSELDEAFVETVQEAFRSLATLPSGTPLQRLSSLRQRLASEPTPVPIALALVDHLSSVLAHATGDYGQAEISWREAERTWTKIGAMERLRGSWLKVYQQAGRDQQLDAFVETLPQKLYNPFTQSVTGWKTSGELEAPTENADPALAWADLLKQAWLAARRGDFPLAVRHSTQAEKRAREIAADDIRVCYAINSQAVFCQMMGSYSESEGLWQDCQQMWRRGAMTLTARTGWNDFCDVLEETQWLDQAEKVRACWPQPTVKPDRVALLDPSEDAQAVQMMRLKDLPDPNAEAEEPAPVEPKRGWLGKLFGRKG